MQDCFEAILTSKSSCTASNAGSDGRIRVYIGCSHPIQTRAPGHRVNQEPIQTRWPNDRATEFESVNDSLGGPVPEFESDGRIRYKLGCDHPSQLFWQCWNRQADCPTPEKIYLHGENTQEGTITMKKIITRCLATKFES
ncbi:hypothetical protein PCANC_28663, partial [Puccinia coronata f. sp. avenae]